MKKNKNVVFKERYIDDSEPAILWTIAKDMELPPRRKYRWFHFFRRIWDVFFPLHIRNEDAFEIETGKRLAKMLGCAFIDVKTGVLYRLYKRERIAWNDTHLPELAITDRAKSFWIKHGQPDFYVMRNPCGRHSPDVILVHKGKVILKIECKFKKEKSPDFILNDGFPHRSGDWFYMFYLLDLWKEGEQCCFVVRQNKFLKGFTDEEIQQMKKEILEGAIETIQKGLQGEKVTRSIPYEHLDLEGRLRFCHAIRIRMRKR
jgi:hypothetical protein